MNRVPGFYHMAETELDCPGMGIGQTDGLMGRTWKRIRHGNKYHYFMLTRMPFPHSCKCEEMIFQPGDGDLMWCSVVDDQIRCFFDALL